MALTEEQILQLRERFGISPEGVGVSQDGDALTAEQRISRRRGLIEAKEPTATQAAQPRSFLRGAKDFLVGGAKQTIGGLTGPFPGDFGERLSREGAQQVAGALKGGVATITEGFKEGVETAEKSRQELREARETGRVGPVRGAVEQVGVGIQTVGLPFSRAIGNIFGATVGDAVQKSVEALQFLTEGAQEEIRQRIPGITTFGEQLDQGEQIIKERFGRLQPETQEEIKRSITNFGRTLEVIADLIGAGAIFKRGLKKGLQEGAAKLEASAVAKEEAAQAGFARELIRPEQTKKVKIEQVPRTTEVGKGPFKKSIIEPTPRELRAEQAVLTIEGVDPKKTVQQNFNVIQKANVDEAIKLEAALKENDFIFPKKELNARIKEAKRRLGESPLIVGDAEKTAEKLIAKFQQFVDEEGATGSGLLRARKKYDKWVKKQKPKAFDANTENAFTTANTEIRNTVNSFLDEKAIDVDVKASLARQRALFDALDNIAPKAATEADTAFGRALQKASKALGTKNRIVQGLAAAVGIGGLGAAAIFAPIVAVAGVTGLLVFKGGKLILNPVVRKGLGQALKALEKARATATSSAEINKINAARKGIQDFIRQVEKGELEASEEEAE